MKILVDADFTVYKCTAAAEDEIDFGNDVIVVSSRFTDAYSAVERELNKISMQFKPSDELILFFSDSENFRKTIEPSYKGHRNRKKPCGYRRVINKLKDDYSVITMLRWKQMMHLVYMLHNIQEMLLYLPIKI